MAKQEYKRILLVRTDRLGDVILTTPAIKVLRNSFPDAYLAMMVRPYTELVVKGNPYLNEVIVYDKYGRHRSMIASIGFAMELRRKNFDLCIVFHPTNRTHIITYLAGIPRRIGYDENFSFLLTDRIKNTKPEGRKHELDYNLDMLKLLGIEAKERQLYLPVDNEATKFIDQLLKESEIEKNDRVITIHPGASCPSKIWPSERFAKLADRLIQSYRVTPALSKSGLAEARKGGVKIVVIGGEGQRDTFSVNSVKKFMLEEALFLSGSLNVPRLAALLKRSSLFVSNDSGPVHVAVAVKTPVVAIFGRNQPGLNPTRWGPLGSKDIVLHKDVGCSGVCLAHNCKRGFECLKAISVEDVFSAILRIGVLD